MNRGISLNRSWSKSWLYIRSATTDRGHPSVFGFASDDSVLVGVDSHSVEKLGQISGWYKRVQTVAKLAGAISRPNVEEKENKCSHK
jgi:hypothetical protein